MYRKFAAVLGLLVACTGYAQSPQVLSVRIDGKNNNMAGAAAIGDASTVWNNLVLPAASGSSKSQDLFADRALVDQAGAATSVKFTLNVTGTSTVNNIIHTYADTGTYDPAPSALMGGYVYYWWSAKLTGTLSGLKPNSTYRLYGYGTGNADKQGSGWSFDAAAGGAAMDAKADFTSTKSTRNVTKPENLGHSYVKIDGTTDAAGKLVFYVTKAANGADPYMNGFQLMPFPQGSISAQPVSKASFMAGGSFSLGLVASGEGNISYQWRKNGIALPSSNASASTAELVVSGAQAADAGTYDCVVTNPGGSITSSACTVSLVTTALAPAVEGKLEALNAQADASVSFSVGVAGTHPLSYQWQKSTDGTNFADISGAVSPRLSLKAVKTTDAGYYRLNVSNSAGSVTSSVGTLTVVPVLTEPLANAAVTPKSAYSVTVRADAGAGSPTPLRYQWYFGGVKLSDSTTVTGTTSATLKFSSFGTANSGLYSVVVSNAAGSVTSNSAYLGAATLLTSSPWPLNGAAGVNPDTPFKIVFSGPVQIGSYGKVIIYDAATDKPVETYNLAEYTPFVAAPEDKPTTISYPGFVTKTVQGTSFLYQPVVAYGNEVWIRPSSSTLLSYGKSYYVTVDPGVILDASGATFAGLSTKTAWRISTKIAAPSSSTLTVAVDGSGDFSTIQGACDLVPKNNVSTTPYTILVAPGIYREHVFLMQGRNYVTLRGTGPSRKSAQIVEIGVDGSYNAVVRMMSTDIRVQNLTIENTVGPVGPKMALLLDAPRQVYENVLIKGWQDTLAVWNNASAYFYNCEIWGSVDFIYSGGLGVFDKCDLVQIRKNGGYYTAPSTDAANKYGLVFLNSRFLRGQVANGQPYDVDAGSSYIMRPWYPNGNTTIINCWTDDGVPTKGWSEWGDREKTCRASEYGTKLLNGGTPVTVAQRQAAGAYWLTEAVPADYSLKAIFGAYYPVPTNITSDQNCFSGSAVALSFPVTASGYQWYHNNALIPGATSATLTLPKLQDRDGGTYTLVATAANGSKTTYSTTINVVALAGASTTPTTPSTSTGHIQVFSVRGLAGTGDDTMIAGFIVDSAGPRDVMVRALSTSLDQFGVTGTLKDPRLSLYKASGILAQNDDWGNGQFSAEIADAASRVGALSLPVASKESTIYSQLNAGAYSAMISTADASTGVAMLEVFDTTINGDSSRLSYISARGKVAPGDSTMIMGLVIGGSSKVKLLVRAVGPGLAAQGLKGTLADPRLNVFRGSTMIASNDNWEAEADTIAKASNSVGYYALGAGSKDAALVLELDPGVYTVHVTGAGTGSGIAILEVAELP